MSRGLGGKRGRWERLYNPGFKRRVSKKNWFLACFYCFFLAYFIFHGIFYGFRLIYNTIGLAKTISFGLVEGICELNGFKTKYLGG